MLKLWHYALDSLKIFLYFFIAFQNIRTKINPINERTSEIEGLNNYFFNESLDTFRFNYNLRESNLQIKDFVAKKAAGKIFSFVEYNYKKNIVDAWVKLSKLPVNEINYYSIVILLFVA